MISYELVLPYPPSNNHYKGIVSGNRLKFYIPGVTKRFHHEVAFRFKFQKGIEMGSRRIKIEVDVYPPQGKRCYDLDNIPKVLLDSLQKAGAYKNDSQVDYLLITRKEKYANGALKVRISEFHNCVNYGTCNCDFNFFETAEI